MLISVFLNDSAVFSAFEVDWMATLRKLAGLGGHAIICYYLGFLPVSYPSGKSSLFYLVVIRSLPWFNGASFRKSPTAVYSSILIVFCRSTLILASLIVN